MNDIFNLEVSEKRKNLSGARSRTSRTGRVGKIFFPSDLLQKKEKRNYTKNGKVVRYNMYDTIIDYSTFLSLNKDMQKELLLKYKSMYRIKDIVAGLGCGYGTLYKHFNELGIAYSKRKNKLSVISISDETTKEEKEEKEAVEATETVKPTLTTNGAETDNSDNDVKYGNICDNATSAPTNAETHSPSVIENKKNGDNVTDCGMTFVYNKEISGDAVAQLLNRLSILLEGDDATYVVQINIKEKKGD